MADACPDGVVYATRAGISRLPLPFSIVREHLSSEDVTILRAAEVQSMQAIAQGFERSTNAKSSEPPAGQGEQVNWYLLRTKRGKERCVHDQLEAIVPQVFLPLLRTRVSRRGDGERGVLPLFPCYLFARFDLQERYFDVKYLPGVAGLVSAGTEPIPVPPLVVDEIRRRGVDGIVEPRGNILKKNDCVRVVEGPFKGFDAIFERYVSSAERVAILLSTVGVGGLRVVLPSAAVVAETKS